MKPIISSTLPAKLCSTCIDMIEIPNGHFDAFIRLSSSGFRHLKLPMNFHPGFRKRKLEEWKGLGGVELSESQIIFIQQKATPPLRREGKPLGADTGIKSVITLSDGQSFRPDRDGHTLESITEKLSRKEKGSKAFRRAQDHRLNYSNWSVKQLNLGVSRRSD